MAVGYTMILGPAMQRRPSSCDGQQQRLEGNKRTTDDTTIIILVNN
jgi:hypothetical protein